MPHQSDKPNFSELLGIYFKDVRLFDGTARYTFDTVRLYSEVRRLDDITFWGHMSRHDVTSFSSVASYRKNPGNFKSGNEVCYLHNRNLAWRNIAVDLSSLLLLLLVRYRVALYCLQQNHSLRPDSIVAHLLQRRLITCSQETGKNQMNPAHTL
jgi:hypothetical protein